MHNGVFQTLEQVVRYYNTRGTLPICPSNIIEAGCWPPPEVSENVDTQFMGNPDLNEQEVADIVTFLQTLTDGYVLPPP